MGADNNQYLQCFEGFYHSTKSQKRQQIWQRKYLQKTCARPGLMQLSEYLHRTPEPQTTYPHLKKLLTLGYTFLNIFKSSC